MNKGIIIKRLVIGLMALSLLALPLIAACSQPAPAPAPKTTAPAPAPTTAAPAPKPTTAPAPSPSPTPVSKLPDTLKWDISAWGAPRAMTYPVEDFIKDMAAATGGRWQLKLHYGEVLAPTKDAVDGLKANMYQGVMIASMYHPGKTPLLTVGENPFLSPSTIPQIGDWYMAIAKHPAVVKELDSWNAQVLFPTPLPQYNYMGKVPFKKVEDLKGLRMRIDPVGGAPLEAYGAVLNNVIAPEIYAAMEKGMLDGVMAIWTYYFGAYKLNELSKYATIGIDLKVTPMYLLVSKTAWAALPPEWQKLASDWAATKTNAKFKEYMDIDDAKWLPIYQKQLEISTLPAAERAKLVEKAKPAWDKWVNEMAAKGLPGQEVLNYAMAERDKILAKK